MLQLSTTRKELKLRKLDLNLLHNNINDKDKEKEVFVYDELGYFKYNKIPMLKLVCNKSGKSKHSMFFMCYKGKKILEVNVTDVSLSDKPSLSMILLMIEEQAEKLKVARVHICIIPVEEFKEVGNNTLNRLRIIVDNSTIFINDEGEKLAILRKLRPANTHPIF